MTLRVSLAATEYFAYFRSMVHFYLAYFTIAKLNTAA